MIKTVIFDLGGVIVPLDFPRGFAAFAAVCDVPADQVRERISSTDLVVRLEKGTVEPEDFHREICDLLGMSVNFDEFGDLWSSIFLPHTLVSEALLASLAERYPLLLLSNTNAIHFPFVRERYGLLRHFRSFILSHELGVMKPDPEIYHAAVARSGCQAGECLFIDDVMENVDGAKRVGLDAVQFLGEEQLKEELRTRALIRGQAT